jgi:hydroxycarboxylate dehydrogenase B
VETVTVPAAALEAYAIRIFEKAGCTSDEAQRIGQNLVGANLAGHDSHGVLRVPRYVQWLHDGKVRAGQTFTVVTESANHAIVDGNKGFGQTIGPLAVDLGIAKAKEGGLSIIGIRNTGHLGRIGEWAERAAAAGLVSIHFVNVGMGLLVAPFGGVDRRFGTNPFCVGAPRDGGQPPLLLDFATSLVAEGKVLVAAQGGKPIPPDALIAPDGTLSGDPEVMFGPIAGRTVLDASGGEGALRAFGDHKGSGIAFMCEILAGCLTGSPTGGSSPEGRRGGIVNGMLSFYLAPAHFAAEHFTELAAGVTSYVKASRPASPGGEVLVPGEAESRTRAARLRDGVPLPATVWSAIRATGESVGASAPEAGLA